MSSAAGVSFQPPPAPPANTSVTGWVRSTARMISLAQFTGALLLALVRGIITNAVWAGGILARTLVFAATGVYSVAAWPIARAIELLRFLLSPVTYTLSYVFAPVISFFTFLTRLRPLYTYLGSAAFVGIVTGLVLKFASSYFFVALNLDDKDGGDDRDDESTVSSSLRPRQLQHERLSRTTRQLRSTTQPTPTPPVRPTAPTVKTEDAILSSQDDVWQWLEEFNPKLPAVAAEADTADAVSLSQKPGPRPGGLLALTIMEESSSE